MLTNLKVQDFAIIEDIDISFKEGLTVLTGETGAGKSLIIDSIDLLLGERASSEKIRNGKDKAVVTGIFTFKNSRLSSLLDVLEIPHLNNKLVISRTISNKNNVIKINDKVITLNELKQISKYLADIHQQFDMVKLLNKDNYLEIVDGFNYDLINEYKNKYLSSLEELKEKYQEYLSLEKRINDIKERQDIYEYELKELEAFNLRIDEEEELNNRIEVMKNYDKVFALLEEIRNIIDKDSLSDLYTVKEDLSKLSDYSNEYSELHHKIEDHYYEIEAIYDDIKKKFNRLDYDPNELDELIARQSDLNILKKKYKKDVKELIEYKDELSLILSKKEDFDLSLKEEKDKLLDLYKKTYISALDLSKIRKETSSSIEEELMNNLKDLDLSSKFKIEVSSKELSKDIDMSIFNNEGIDEIEFYIETNIGEGLKPLSKIVSGGEMSRIMLAIKALFIKSQKISTVIFDEVDTGISGVAASKVANKIKEISLSTQVITITHIPQVASLSNNHIKISKSVSNGRTHTSIKELSLEEKIMEIAMLISDGKVTDNQIKYAKEMVLGK